MSLYTFSSFFYISDMVRTRGGSRVRPRVRFSTPEREAAAPVPALVPELEVAVPAPVSEPAPAPEPSPVPGAVPDEPLGFRRYQTRVGPRAPSPVPQRRVRRARPSKRARTSGPGESSSSRPPITTTAVRWLGFFLVYVQFQLYQLPTNFD